MNPTHAPASSSRNFHAARRIRSARKQCLIACLLLAASLASTVQAQSLYWDTNGVVVGTGVAPVGVWGTDSFWSTDANGEVATGPWTPGADAVFSAGSDAVGGFTVELSAAQAVGSLTFEEGNVVLVGATPATNITWNGAVNVGSGASAIVNALLLGNGGLTKGGAGFLTLGATNNFSGNVAVTAGTLGFSADANFGAIPGAFVADSISLADGSGLRFSGGIVTFATTRGLTLSGTVTLDCTSSILLSESPIAGTGATLFKTGPAEFRSYKNPNSFSRLVVNQGTYTAGTATFLGLDESFGAVPAVLTPDAITISNAATLRTVGGGAVTISANRGITIGPGGAIIQNDVQALTINSLITGDGGLTKTGNRNLTNNAPISYAGPTTINGGTAASSAIVTLNGHGTAPGLLTINAGRVIVNNANAFSGVTVVTGRIDANTNGALGGGTVTFSPTNNIVFVNATTLGVGALTNVTLGNDIVLNVGSTLSGGSTFVDISANAGREFILNGKVSGGGIWKKDNGGSSGALVLANSGNDFTTSVTNFSGTIIAAANNALGSAAGNTVVNSGASLAFRGGIDYTTPEPVTISGAGRLSSGAISNDSGNNSFSGPVTLAADAAVGGAPGTLLTLNGVIGEAGGPRVLTKSTAGTVKLTQDNQYSGGTVVSAGTLVVANTAGSATGPGPVTIQAGATLSGPGSVAGTVTVNGTIAPGSSPGTQNTASQIWNSGGTYVWELNDVDAGQGGDPGWDLISIIGSLTINATAAGKFNLAIRSLDLANVAGSVADFDNATDYVWTILKTTGGITGFDAAAFNVVTSGFSNPLGAGLFLMETANSGNDLVLRFVRTPGIAVQPVNQSAECAVGSASFSVVATGTAPLTYQWRLNGNAIAGANAATLTVLPAVSSTAGNYDVVVANSFGSVTSTVATLVLTDALAPTITVCAPNQTLSAGVNCLVAIPDLTGLVTASDNCSAVALSQSPLPGTLVGVGVHNVTITATDAANNSATCVASVTVNDTTAPEITACAPNQTITAGGANCMAAIPDLTTLVTAADACGPVTITQSPAAGTMVAVGAHPVTLTVADAANNTATCQATVTVNSSVTVAVNSPTVCLGGSATLTATTAAASPSYLWSPGGETTASITVAPDSTTTYSVTVTDVSGCVGSGTAVVTVRAFDTFSNANPITINDDATASPYPSLINVSGLTATVCKVTVTLNGFSHPYPADVDMLLVAPDGQSVVLMSDVGAGNSLSGVTLTFEDAAANSLPEDGLITTGSYKPTNLGTKLDGFPSPAPAGPHGTTLTALSGINPNGGWSLLIVDDEGVDAGQIAGGWSLAISTVTPLADLAVTQVPSPAPVAVGSNLTLTVTVANLGPAAASNVEATNVLPAGFTFISATSDIGSCNQSSGVVTCSVGGLNAGASATITMVVVPSVAGTEVNVASAGSSTLDLVASNNSTSASVVTLEPAVITAQPANLAVCAGASAGFSVTATGSGPLTYQWFYNETNLLAAETGPTLSIASAVAESGGTYSVVVGNAASSAVSDVVVLTVNSIPAVAVNSETICLGASATLTAATSAANPTYLWNPGGATTASISVSPGTTTIYTVTVTDGTTGCVGVGSGTVTVNQPVTASPLQSVTDLCPGSSVEFATFTAGTGPLTYAWRKDGVLLAETSDTLSIAAVVAGDAGVYSVEVTGFCSAVTNSATLTVAVPPTIVAQPQNQTTPEGDGAVFSVTVTGTSPITYQWQRNGTDISGATTSSLAVSNLSLAQSGSLYSVVVSNCAGSSLSAAATLTVLDIVPPQLVSCAAPLTLSSDEACTARMPDLTAQLIVTDSSAVSITQDPMAGSVLAAGMTIVTLTATDTSGNSTNCTTTASVVDRTAPVISCPTNITVVCGDTNGAVVSYLATAIDSCDASPVVTTVPASGSTFPLGTNVVTVTAVDVSGNTNSCSFTVTVKDPIVPTLTIAPIRANVVVSWPRTCTAYVLEEAAEFGAHTVWTPVTDTILAVGADYQLAVPANSGNKFYRLKKQP